MLEGHNMEGQVLGCSQEWFSKEQKGMKERKAHEDPQGIFRH